MFKNVGQSNIAVLLFRCVVGCWTFRQGNMIVQNFLLNETKGCQTLCGIQNVFYWPVHLLYLTP